jgi:hypothetical protein
MENLIPTERRHKSPILAAKAGYQNRILRSRKKLLNKNFYFNWFHKTNAFLNKEIIVITYFNFICYNIVITSFDGIKTKKNR